MAVFQFTKAIAAAATPERLIPVPAAGDPQILASLVHIEPWNSNTEVVYVGDRSTMTATGFVGIMSALDPVVAEPTLKEVDIYSPAGNNSISVPDIWIRAAVNGEGVKGFYVVE